MRTRVFKRSMAVSDQVIAEAPKDELEAYVRGQLEADFGEVRGPRGGRYVAAGPVGELRSGQVRDDWMRATTTYVIERPMRYVRPKRKEGAE